MDADTDNVAEDVPTWGFTTTEVNFEALPVQDVMGYDSTWVNGGYFQANQDVDMIEISSSGTWGMAWDYATIHGV